MDSTAVATGIVQSITGEATVLINALLTAAFIIYKFIQRVRGR